MAFDINTFRSELATNGYLRPWEYNVTITPPTGLTGSTFTNQNQSLSAGNVQSLISLRATQARTPSAQIEWLDVPRYGIGLKQGAPYNAQIKDCAFAVICDKYGNLYNFFHSWLNSVFAFSPLYNSQGGTTSNQNRASYLVNYPDNFVAQAVQINMYDQIGDLALEFVLNRAFPVTLREILLDWEEGKQLVELTVVLDYRDFSVATSNLGQGTQASDLTSPVSTTATTRIPLINQT